MTTNNEFRSGQVFTNRIAETVHFFELERQLTAVADAVGGPQVWAARWVTVHIPTNERTDRPMVIIPARELVGWRQLKAKCSGWYAGTCASCGTVDPHDHEEL